MSLCLSNGVIFIWCVAAWCCVLISVLFFFENRDHFQVSISKFTNGLVAKQYQNTAAKTILTPTTSSPKTVIITFTDITYLHACEIWIKRMKILGYIKSIKIYALDDEAFKKLKETNRISFRLPNNRTFQLSDHQIELVPDYSVHRPDQSWRWRPKTQKIWRTRIARTVFLLKNNYNVFLTDVDSLWNRYVDLEKLPGEFDSFHALAGGFPDSIFQKWGFTFCGGLGFYRSTPGNIMFWQEVLRRCGGKCDDQVVLNELYYDLGLKFFGVDDVNDESGLRFYKCGMVRTENLDLKIIIVSELDMLRGGTPKNCNTTWIMNPVTRKTGANKYQMFKTDFAECDLT